MGGLEVAVEQDTLWGVGAEAPNLLVQDEPVVRGGFAPVERHSALRRLAFLLVTTFGAGLIGFVTLGASHYTVDGQVFACTGQPSLCSKTPPYLVLSFISGLLLAGAFLKSRPDKHFKDVGFIEEWVHAIKGVSLAAVAIVLFAFFWRPAPINVFSFSRGTLLLTWAYGVLAYGGYRTAVRWLLMGLRSRGANLSPVVVVGNTMAAQLFIKRVSDQPSSGYRVVHHLKRPAAEGLSLTRSLLELREVVHFEEVVLASSDLPDNEVGRLASQPQLRDVQFRAIPEFFGLAPAKIELQTVNDFPLVTLFYNPVKGVRWAIKRSIDLVACIALLIISAPVMLVAALLIKMTSPGPVLFRQERVGMDGRRFTMLKFRTMFDGTSDAYHRDLMASLLTGENATSDDGPDDGLYKPRHDPRITSVGRYLRRFSLDELPQLFNVLRCEMSLVGPRPAIDYEVELYEEWQRRRLDVLPGITGLWQVSGRSRLSPSEMLRLDVLYAEAWTLGADVRILFRTLPVLLRKDAS